MMQRLKILGSALIALSFSASAVVAQQFDPKQGYEIHTVNGLVLDNRRVWIRIRKYLSVSGRQTKNRRSGT